MITDFKDLKKIRERHKDKKIVFCSGGFDLTHAGHVLFFEDCKALGDILIVMVGNDTSMKRQKGEGRPVVNQYLRMKMVDSLKPVDYCFVDFELPKETKLLYMVDLVFSQLKPNVYVINKDAFDIPYREELVKKHGVELVILERTCPQEYENVSATNLIVKIKKSAT